MADRRALQPLRPLSRFQILLQQNHDFPYFRRPAIYPVNQLYYFPEEELIDGHLCLNDQSVSQIPWEDEAENHQPPSPPPPTEESTWRSLDNVEIFYEDELDEDYTPILPNDGFSEETIADHLQTTTHHKYANQETGICVVCQSEYEENEKLGRLRCGHEYHADCVTRWLLVRKFCPVCKRIA